MSTIRPMLLSLALGGVLAGGAAIAQTTPAPLPTQAIPRTTTPTRHPAAPLAPLAPPAASTAAPPGTAMAPRRDQRLQQQQRTLHSRVRAMSNRADQNKPVARSAEGRPPYPATSGSTH